MKVVAVIPARYSSTRLPGKPLKEIEGKPMVWWVHNIVSQADTLSKIIVATDCDEIYKVCHSYGVDVMLTSASHPTAIHRLQEVSQKVMADLYLQVNGDEPLISVEAVNKAIHADINLIGASGLNIITKIKNPIEAMDIANIKVVFDEDHVCTYMSRTPIPFPFKTLEYSYYKHVGIIGYTKEMLDFFVNSEQGYLEKIEGIDLLRFIDYGKQLHLIEVSECNSLSVDTEKDLVEVRRRMRELLN